MGMKDPKPRRRHDRFLVDLPLSLWDSSHHLLDSRAVAHDVTPAGFGFETKADLRHLIRVYFELELPDGRSVSGSARVVWSQGFDWGRWGGARIVEISWSDARKIRRVIRGPGYDWAGLADRFLLAATIVAAVFVAQQLLSRHPDALLAFPWLALAAGVAAAVFYFSRER